jgi:signal transduction histidine kinase
VCELTGADSAVISLVEGDEVVLHGSYGFDAANATGRRKVSDSRVGRVIAERRPFTSIDMQRDPHWKDSNITRRGYRAVLDVPIILRDQVIGVLGVLSKQPRAFSEEDAALLLSLAGHTAVAIDRTNLVRQLTVRLEESQTLLSVSQAVSSTLDLGEMMRRVAMAVAKALGCDMVGAYLADADGSVLRPIAGYHVPPHLRTMDPIPLHGFPLVEEAWRTQQPVASADAEADRRIHRGAFERFRHRSIVFVPMIVKGEPIGGLFAIWWVKAFTPTRQDLRLVEGIASQAAVAIENSRLYEGVKRQMAELEQAQAQLIQSTKLAAIGELAANIAHEINNPLTTVLGFASFLAERLEPGAPTLEELTLIQEEASRARDIVRDLLQFSRQSDVHPTMSDVNIIVEQVIGMLRRQGAIDAITLEEEYAADLPLIEMDVSRMKQVFLNIINNAIYAMPNGGALTVRSVRREAFVDVEFTDTGSGIDPEALPRIFDPFFTTKPEVSGTGLGLSVSLGIVQSHGGTIAVTSTRDVGTTFTVRLPVEPKTQPATHAAP